MIPNRIGIFFTLGATHAGNSGFSNSEALAETKTNVAVPFLSSWIFQPFLHLPLAQLMQGSQKQSRSLFVWPSHILKKKNQNKSLNRKKSILFGWLLAARQAQPGTESFQLPVGQLGFPFAPMYLLALAEFCPPVSSLKPRLAGV